MYLAEAISDAVEIEGVIANASALGIAILVESAKIKEGTILSPDGWEERLVPGWVRNARDPQALHDKPKGPVGPEPARRGQGLKKPRKEDKQEHSCVQAQNRGAVHGQMSGRQGNTDSERAQVAGRPTQQRRRPDDW